MPTPSEVEIRRVREQVHSGNYNIYPKLAAGVTLSADANAYTPSGYVEIIPANTITTSFWIIGAVIFDASSGVEYVIDIATGTAGSEADIGTLCFKFGSTGGIVDTGGFQGGAFQSDAFQVASTQNSSIIPSQDPVFPVAVKVAKNTRVSMRLATSIGGYTCKAKVKYKL